MSKNFDLLSFEQYLKKQNNASATNYHLQVVQNINSVMSDLGLPVAVFTTSSLTKLKMYALTIQNKRPFQNRPVAQQVKLIKALTLLIDYVKNLMGYNNTPRPGDPKKSEAVETVEKTVGSNKPTYIEKIFKSVFLKRIAKIVDHLFKKFRLTLLRSTYY